MYVCIRMHVEKICTRESEYCAPTYIHILSLYLFSNYYRIKRCLGSWGYQFLGSWHAYPGRNEGEIKSTCIHT